MTMPSALLRLRSGIFGVVFPRKSRRRAGFEACLHRTCSVSLPRRNFALYMYCFWAIHTPFS